MQFTPNLYKKEMKSGRNAWSNEESELLVRAPAPLASPLSVCLAKIWGFARLGPFCKKQQMQWSKRGAHLLLQTRVKKLNRELGSVFKRWYPDMQVEEMPDAA